MNRHRAEYLAGLMLAAIQHAEERARKARHQTGLPWPSEQREEAAALFFEIASSLFISPNSKKTKTPDVA